MTIVYIVFCNNKKHLKNRFLHKNKLILKVFSEMFLARVPACDARKPLKLCLCRYIFRLCRHLILIGCLGCGMVRAALKALYILKHTYHV